MDRGSVGQGQGGRLSVPADEWVGRELAEYFLAPAVRGVVWAFEVWSWFYECG